MILKASTLWRLLAPPVPSSSLAAVGAPGPAATAAAPAVGVAVGVGVGVAAGHGAARAAAAALEPRLAPPLARLLALVLALLAAGDLVALVLAHVLAGVLRLLLLRFRGLGLGLVVFDADDVHGEALLLELLRDAHRVDGADHRQRALLGVNVHRLDPCSRHSVQG